MTGARHSHFILGGARSGKSRYAVSEARSLRCRTAFVATAGATDSDMQRRIERHRRERPPDWITVEEPLDLCSVCRELARRVDLIVIDCLTLWVSNQMASGTDDGAIVARAEALAALIGDRTVSWIAVSNEAGEGVHPSTPLGLRFRDLLGTVNQAVAAAAERVTLMVAGIPVAIKPAAAATGIGPDSRERVPEAP